MIFLAIITHNNTDSYNEYHIRYTGHKDLLSAKTEIKEVRSRLVKDGKAPLDCYVYESSTDVPLYGYTPYNLDQIDFNFYRDLTPEEEARRQKVISDLEKV
jgi:hypothetical protein